VSVLQVLAVLLAASPAADLEAIRSAGTLRVLAVQHHKSDEFFSPGVAGPPGFDYEMLDAFAQFQKLRLQVVTVPGWDELIPALKEGRGDVVAGRFTVTEARQRLVTFTSEVFPSRNVVVTRKPRPPVLNVEQLRKERVGTIRGTSLAEAVSTARVPPANVDDSFPPGGLPGGLKDAKVTAVVLGVESAIAAQRQDPELELGTFLGPPRSLAYAVRKEDTQLLAALNAYVENVRRTPTWNRLVVKYFGVSAPSILRTAREQQ
jgi:membrane-bound lytic murein transglycosylase F